MKKIAIDWREKLRAERARQIEHHQDSLQMKIKVSREAVEKDRYPMEKEPQLATSKTFERSKDRGIDLEI